MGDVLKRAEIALRGWVGDPPIVHELIAEVRELRGTVVAQARENPGYRAIAVRGGWFERQPYPSVPDDDVLRLTLERLGYKRPAFKERPHA